MENKNLTPEERLLKIIENPGNPAGLSPRPSGVREDRKSAPAGSIFRMPAGRLTLKTAVQLSVAAAVLATLFLLYDYLSTSRDTAGRLNKVLSRGTEDIAVESAAEKAPELKDLLGLAGKHNIFAVEPGKAESLLDSETAQVISSLKLVGILWSEKPQAMVEDTKSSKTFLLNDGDSLNDLRVKKIYVDKIVLSKDGKDWELR